MTPENVRFHAAGHLAAAVALTHAGNVEGARTLYRIVRTYLDAPNVDNPPQFRATVDRAISDPASETASIVRLEALFCDPHNTALENANMRGGKG